VALELANRQFNRALDQSQKSLEKFGDNVERIGRDFDGVFDRAAIGSAALGAALTGLVTTAVQQADAIVDLANAYELNVGQVYELRQALQEAGGEANNAGRFYADLARSIDEAASGNQRTLDTFRQLGISITDLGRLSSTELRDRLISALADIPDAATRSALATQLFGNSLRGVDIREFSNQLQENAGRFDATGASARIAADAMGNIERILGDLQRAALQAFTPLLRAISQIRIDFDDLVIAVKAVTAAFVVMTGAAVIGGMVKLVAQAKALTSVLRRNPVVALAGLALSLGVSAGVIKDVFAETEDAASGVDQQSKNIAGSTGETQRNVQGALDLLERQRSAMSAITDQFGKQNAAAITAVQNAGRRLTMTQDEIQLEDALRAQRERTAAALTALENNYRSLTQQGRAEQRSFYEEQRRTIEANGAAALRSLEEQIRKNQYLTQIVGKFNEASRELAAGDRRIFDIKSQNLLAAAGLKERVALEEKLAAIAKLRESTLAKIAQLPEREQIAVREAIGIMFEDVTLLEQSFDKLGTTIIEQFKALRDQGRITEEQFNAIFGAPFIRATVSGAEAVAQFRSRTQEEAALFSTGWQQATQNFVDSARNGAATARSLFETATRGMEDALVNFAKTGKLSFKSLISGIVDIILRSQINKLLAQVFGGQGGNFLSSLFAGFFADGGRIPAGRFGVVGERGPELVGGPATVTPMAAVGAATGPTMVTYNINATDVDSFRRLLAQDPEFLFAVTEQGRRRIPTSRR
jgi:hypothetical protein